MPVLTNPTRRNFLLSSAAAGALSLSVAGPAQGQRADGRVKWALLSDTHIPVDPENGHRGFKPVDNLRKVVPQVVDFEPEGAVIAGDLARLKGLLPDYRTLDTLLKPVTDRIPVAMALGNHDDRKNFLQVFEKRAGAQPVTNKHVLVVEAGPVRLVVLDSLMMVDFVPGLLGKAQRTWLDEYLKSSSDIPTLLFVHHTLDDQDGSLLDSDRFFNLIRLHRKVKAVFYGHSHRYHYDELDGIHLVNLPAVGYNFNDREPVGWVEAAFSREGAALTLRAFGGNMAEGGKSRSLAWRS